MHAIQKGWTQIHNAEINWHSRDWAIQGPPGAHAAAQPKSDRNLRSGGRRREPAAQEIANCASNFFMVRFECEVTGVVEMHFSVRVVELERFSTIGQEERIILAPDS